MRVSKALHMNDILNSPLNKKVESVNSSYVAKMMNGDVPEPDEKILQKNGTMHVHIEITRENQGSSMYIKAVIENQNDLTVFWEKTQDYMPSVGILCRIKEMFRR